MVDCPPESSSVTWTAIVLVAVVFLELSVLASLNINNDICGNYVSINLGADDVMRPKGYTVCATPIDRD